MAVSRKEAPGGCETYRPLLSQYDWDVATAMAIMQAESGCNPTEDNAGLNEDGTNDVGLMQINSVHVQSGLITEQARFEPSANVKAAYAIYEGSGWSAWTAFNNGKYRKYL